MGARNVAAMTSQAVLQPHGVCGYTFVAKAFKFRPQVLGPRILRISAVNWACSVAQRTLQAVVDGKVIQLHIAPPL